MRPEEIAAKIRSRARDIEALGVIGLFLFGSHARGAGRPDGDVDFFFDAAPERLGRLEERFRLEDFLSALLAAKVDIGARDELHPVIRREVEERAVRIL